METPEEKLPDTIEVPDGEKITFSDKPDGTPADVAEQVDTKAEEKADVKADVAATPAEDQKPKRNRKDYRERINELVRSAHEAKERAAAAETKAQLLDEELRTLREQQRTQVNETQTKAEQDLIARKKKALDDGDLAAYDEANEALLDLRLQRRVEPKPEKPEEKPEKKPDAKADEVHPSAKSWLDRNAWFNAQENQHLAKAAMQIEARLRMPKDKGGSGLELGEELYKKLDEELANLPDFDDVRGVADDPETDQAVETQAETRADTSQERPRTVVASPSRGGEPPAKPKTGSLTRYDIQTMRTFGLDPNNTKHRAAYLARKSGGNSA